MSNADAITSLANFSKAISRLGRVVGNRAALIAAPGLTAALRQTFAAGENAYGVTWQPLATGDRATLVKEGKLRDTLEFVAIGRLIRVRLAVAHAKYQVGRRPVTPSQGSRLPQPYVDVLTAAVQQAIREELAV